FSTYLGTVTPSFGPGGFAGYNFNPSPFGPDNGILTPEAQAYRASLFARQAGRAGQVTEGVPYMDNEYWGILSEINADVAGGALTIIPAYREASLDNLFTAGMTGAKTREKDKQSSLEIRYAGRIADAVDVVLGGFMFRERIDTN